MSMGFLTVLDVHVLIYPYRLRNNITFLHYVMLCTCLYLFGLLRNTSVVSFTHFHKLINNYTYQHCYFNAKYYCVLPQIVAHQKGNKTNSASWFFHFPWTNSCLVYPTFSMFLSHCIYPHLTMQ